MSLKVERKWSSLLAPSSLVHFFLFSSYIPSQQQFPLPLFPESLPIPPGCTSPPGPTAPRKEQTSQGIN